MHRHLHLGGVDRLGRRIVELIEELDELLSKAEELRAQRNLACSARLWRAAPLMTSEIADARAIMTAR